MYLRNEYISNPFTKSRLCLSFFNKKVGRPDLRQLMSKKTENLRKTYRGIETV